MSLPEIEVSDVAQLITHAQDIKPVDRGGQKVVFSATIDGQKCAVKFLSPNISEDEEDDILDDVTARARREVETMHQCDTPHLVKMGSIGLTKADLHGKSVIYFTEEFIEGENLKSYHKRIGKLPITELIRLALHISDAIEAIWQFAKIHRDIKPGNIMRRSSDGSFVLLDMGLVLDLQDSSLSVGPVGTPKYFAPEMIDFENRRTIVNFRTDLFALGTVLYEMATGVHPFVSSPTDTTWDVIRNIRTLQPKPPVDLRHDLPAQLNETIMRLLAKRPALRFRSIAMLRRKLESASN